MPASTRTLRPAPPPPLLCLAEKGKKGGKAGEEEEDVLEEQVGGARPRMPVSRCTAGPGPEQHLGIRALLGLQCLVLLVPSWCCNPDQAGGGGLPVPLDIHQPSCLPKHDQTRSPCRSATWTSWRRAAAAPCWPTTAWALRAASPALALAPASWTPAGAQGRRWVALLERRCQQGAVAARAGREEVPCIRWQPPVLPRLAHPSHPAPRPTTSSAPLRAAQLPGAWVRGRGGPGGLRRLRRGGGAACR